MVSAETLVIVRRDNEILLGLKQRAFGKGKWNGPGGKFEEEVDKSLEDCLLRETFEECGILLKKLREIGKTLYVIAGEENHLVRVYTTDTFEKEPKNSEEMVWKWFNVNNIPYDPSSESNGCGMWHNDRYWLPFLLRGEEFNAEIHMDENYVTTSCVINGKRFA